MIPNHICKNENCHKGSDGERKKYFACNFCGRTENWRSIACSFECYQEYMMQVIEARSQNRKISILPERLDMTETEVKKMMEKPVEVVLEETKGQLKDYISEDDSSDFGEIIDKINEELDNKKTTTFRGKKKKESDE